MILLPATVVIFDTFVIPKVTRRLIICRASILRSIHSTDATTYQLCVCPTGRGKSLQFTTLAACLGRITLCISPLLSLGADQRTIKHQKNTISSSEFITLCKATIESFFTVIYASPQALITKAGPSSFLKFLLDHKHVLRMVVIDEIH